MVASAFDQAPSPSDAAPHDADGAPMPAYRHAALAAAGLLTTAEDLRRFGAAIATGAVPGAMTEPAPATDRRYGLAWGSARSARASPATPAEPRLAGARRGPARLRARDRRARESAREVTRSARRRSPSWLHDATYRLGCGNAQPTSPWRGFAFISIAIFIASLDLFIVNIAFPAIGEDFPEASVSGLSWILSAYAIVFAALLVPFGKLGDLVGRLRVFRAGLAVFTLGSALCALAPSAEMLVAARVIQAAGAAALTPTSLGWSSPASRRSAARPSSARGPRSAASAPPWVRRSGVCSSS